MKHAVESPEVLLICMGFPLRGCPCTCMRLPTWACSGYSRGCTCLSCNLRGPFCEKSQCRRENRKKPMCFSLHSPYNSFTVEIENNFHPFCSRGYRAANAKSRTSVGGLGNELRGQRIGLSARISASNPRQLSRRGNLTPTQRLQNI